MSNESESKVVQSSRELIEELDRKIANEIIDLLQQVSPKADEEDFTKIMEMMAIMLFRRLATTSEAICVQKGLPPSIAMINGLESIIENTKKRKKKLMELN